MKADADERGEFFANMAAEGNEELLDELNELEADAVMGDMNAMSVSNAPIINSNPIPQPVPQQ